MFTQSRGSVPSCFSRFLRTCQARWSSVWSDDAFHTSLNLNLLRDFIWAALDALSVDINLRKTDDLEQQWLAQWIYPTAAMGLAYAVSRFYCYRHQREKPPMMPLVTASMGIVPWNASQHYLENALVPYVTSLRARQYISAVGPGLVEGAIGWLIPILIALYNFLRYGNRDGGLYFDVRSRKARIALLDFGLLVTICLLPGAVWQLSYEACSQMNGEDPISVFFISAGTAAATGLANTLVEFLLALIYGAVADSEFFIQKLQWEGRQNIASINSEFSNQLPLLSAFENDSNRL